MRAAKRRKKKRKMGEKLEREREKDDVKHDIGKKEYVYVGETGRCLAERSREHIRGLRNGDKENFIVKHWALHHRKRKEPPTIKFEIVKNHRDCLSRVVHEAVLIDKEGNMNSKSEWRKNAKPRLVIEKEGWEKKKEEKRMKEEEEEEEKIIQEIVERISRWKNT